jgi:hypothetical protein
MSQIIDSPTGIIEEEISLGGYGLFPDTLFLVSVGEDKYACNNATLPDGQTVDGLATFPDPDEATTYMGLLAGLNGEIVKKSFGEAREIAKGKPRLSALFLFVAGKIVEVHYVR